MLDIEHVNIHACAQCPQSMTGFGLPHRAIVNVRLEKVRTPCALEETKESMAIQVQVQVQPLISLSANRWQWQWQSGAQTQAPSRAQVRWRTLVSLVRRTAPPATKHSYLRGTTHTRSANHTQENALGTPRSATPPQSQPVNLRLRRGLGEHVSMPCSPESTSGRS